MRDEDLLDSLRSLGRSSVAPAPDDARAREATIQAMVEAAANPAPAPRARPWRSWMIAAAAVVLLAGGGALTARGLWRSPAASAVAPPVASASPVGYLHGQSGEVVVVGARGAGIAPPPSDRAWSLSAEDRIATLTEGHATVLVGGVASVQLSAATEVTILPAAGVAMEVRAGSAQFDVSKLGPGERFVVRAPDLEVTVHGTSFRVTVDPSRPVGSRSRVTVADGVVSVRPDVGETTALSSGDRWPVDRSSPAGSSSPPSAAAPASGTASASASRSDLTAQNALLEQAASARARGDGAGEARALDSFIARFPKSPGLHDAVAGRMRAADRAGDRSAAAREARRYLALFPSGPLRDEATALVSRGRSPDRP